MADTAHVYDLGDVSDQQRLETSEGAAKPMLMVRTKEISSLRNAQPGSIVISGVGNRYVELTELGKLSDVAEIAGHIRITDRVDLGQVEDIAKAVRNFVLQNPDEDLAPFLRLVIPNLDEFIEVRKAKEWTSFVHKTQMENHSLPLQAKTLWKDRGGRQTINPEQFLRANYEPYLQDTGLKEHLRTIDFQLYNALAQHFRRKGVPEDLPAFELGSSARARENDIRLRELGITSPQDARKKVVDRREASRLAEAARSRQR